MSVGQYDWNIARKLYGSHMYQMSSKAANLPQSARDDEVPLMLALHPDIRLDRLNGLQEYQELIIGLAQVAVLTHRFMISPSLPCDLPPQVAVLTRRVMVAVLTRRVMIIPCLPCDLPSQVAVLTHRVMVIPDLPCDLPWVSSASAPEGPVPHVNTSGSLASQILVLEASDIMEETKKVAHQQVLYLGHPIQVMISSFVYAADILEEIKKVFCQLVLYLGHPIQVMIFVLFFAAYIIMEEMKMVAHQQVHYLGHPIQVMIFALFFAADIIMEEIKTVAHQQVLCLGHPIQVQAVGSWLPHCYEEPCGCPALERSDLPRALDDWKQASNASIVRWLGGIALDGRLYSSNTSMEPMDTDFVPKFG
eukprot:gene3539-13609_t